MPVFPDISPDWGYQVETEDGVVLRRSESGKVWARDRWGGRLRRTWRLKFSALTPEQERQVREFYRARGGRLESFYFFDPDSRRKYTGLSVDETPTGSLDTFTLPGKSCTNVTVYVDGVEETHWSLSQGAGANGEDQIVFDAGYEPAQGSTVTADFTGRRRHLVRFRGGPSFEGRFHPGLGLALVEEF